MWKGVRLTHQRVKLLTKRLEDVANGQVLVWMREERDAGGLREGQLAGTVNYLIAPQETAYPLDKNMRPSSALTPHQK